MFTAWMPVGSAISEWSVRCRAPREAEQFSPVDKRPPGVFTARNRVSNAKLERPSNRELLIFVSKLRFLYAETLFFPLAFYKSPVYY